MKKIIITILTIVITTLIGVGIFLIVFLPSEQNNNEPDINNQPNNEIFPQIFCDDISLYVGQSKVINYTVVCGAEYSVSFSSTFNCLAFDNNNITSSQSGEFNFDINVFFNEKTYSKNVKVFAYQNITDVTYNFYNSRNQIVDKLFVGETYILTVNSDSKIIDSNLTYSENIQILNCENINNKLLITLKILSYDDIEIVFNCYNFSKEITADLFCFIEDFDITFGTQNLYIFNQDYVQQANSDNKYSQTSFSVSVDEKCVSDYDINLSCENVISVNQNIITAIGEGQCKITFSAKDGSGYSENITITVEKIVIDTIEFTDASIELLENESYFVEYSYSPVYAICDLEFDKNLNNGYISFDTAGEYSLVLTDNITNKSCTLEITVVRETSYGFELHFNQSFLDEYSATYENDILTLTGKDTTQITFDYIITPDYTGSIDCSIVVLNNIDMEIEIQSISNAVILTTLDKGSFDVKLTLTSNTSVTFTLKIIIN